MTKVLFYGRNGEVAKALKLGRNRLFNFLKSKGYLMSDNTPYQKYITLGYFDVSERVAFVRGRLVTNVQTLVKPKGVDLISDLLGINQLETMEDISNFIRSRA